MKKQTFAQIIMEMEKGEIVMPLKCRTKVHNHSKLGKGGYKITTLDLLVKYGYFPLMGFSDSLEIANKSVNLN